MRKGIADLSRGSEDARLVFVRFGESGIDAQRLLEVRACCREVLLAGEHVRQIIPGLRIDRPRLDGGLVLSNGLRRVSGLDQMVAVGIMRLRQVRIPAERL